MTVPPPAEQTKVKNNGRVLLDPATNTIGISVANEPVRVQSPAAPRQIHHP